MVQHDGERYADVLVVGGGLAGLAAAATAARESPGGRVVLLESHRPGGRARSEARDGYVLNQGPHALYRDGRGSAVLQGLGVPFTGAFPSKRVFGIVGDRVEMLPTSMGSLLRSRAIGAGGKAKLAWLLGTAARIDTKALAPLSAAGWIRSLGLPEDAAAVLSTLARVASYSPDLELVSADAVARQIQMAAAGNVLYLDGGWQTLVDGLGEAAERAGVQVRAGEAALSVEPLADPAGSTHPLDGHVAGWAVSTPAGAWTAGAVVVACGSPAAAAALVPGAGIEPGGTDATAACLDLGLRRPPERRVVFALDRPLYLSTHSPDARLAPAGAALVHVMRYGARSTAEDKAELRDFARAAGIGEDDVVVERFLHRMVVNHAQPRPGAGLAGRPPVAVAGHRGLFLAGDWVGPVGLLADAALSSGEAAGRAAATRVSSSAGASDPARSEARTGEGRDPGDRARPGTAGEAA